MVKRTENYVPIRQLTRLSFSCPGCGAVATVDIADEHQRAAAITKPNEKYCSVCGDRFLNGFFLALADFIKWYQAAVPLKEDVHFILSDETE